MGCLKICGLLIVLLAVLLGSLPTILRTVLPLIEDREGLETLKGMAPAMHSGKPFGFTFEEIPDLKGKVAIVTGANVGLGYWTALHLARKDASVILACRSMDRCEKAAKAIRQNYTKAQAEPWLLDLGDLASVRAFAEKFNSKFEHLHALVLNAGVMFPPHTLSKDGIELQFATNHVGHHLLSQLLLPALGKSTPSTVTVVSSNAHYTSYPGGIRLTLEEVNDEKTYDRFLAYGQSKLANVLFAQELAQQAPKGVLVNAAHPGAVDTELARHLVTSQKALFGETIGNAIEEYVKPWLSQAIWDPETAALTQLYTAVSPKLIEQKITGKYYHPIARLNTPHAHAQNATLQRALWTFTEELIRTKSK